MTPSLPQATLLALAVAAAFPAAAQTNAEVLNELKALRDRVNQLEQQLKAKMAQIDAHMAQLKTLKKELAATFSALRCAPHQPVAAAHATAPDSGSGAGVAVARRAFAKRQPQST